MKKFLQLVAVPVLAAYIAACVLVSVFVSVGFQRWHWIETRGPLFVVSVDRVRVLDGDWYGSAVGENQHGEKIGFGADPACRPGDDVLCIFVYTPFSGIDGVEWRFDYVLSR